MSLLLGTARSDGRPVVLWVVVRRPTTVGMSVNFVISSAVNGIGFTYHAPSHNEYVHWVARLPPSRTIAVSATVACACCASLIARPGSRAKPQSKNLQKSSHSSLHSQGSQLASLALAHGFQDSVIQQSLRLIAGGDDIRR